MISLWFASLAALVAQLACSAGLVGWRERAVGAAIPASLLVLAAVPLVGR